ncbi:MAG: META domain-containing protein [Propionibacteriaceae bacterium]|nr:META domain-containing protein [Propionibacteriaceae bacterium]
MSTDFEDRLRAELDAERVELPLDTDRVLTSGRRTVRARRVGAIVASLAALVLASLVIPLAMGRAIPAVPVGTPAATTSATRLERTVWRVAALDGTPVTGGLLTLQLGDGSFAGYAGCHTVMGTYTSRAHQLGFTDVQADTSGCGADAARLGSAFVEALSTTAAYQVSAGGLGLIGSDGSRLAELEPFGPDDATWYLRAMDNDSVEGESAPTLVVDGDHVRGSTACVDFTADLTRDGTTWSVTNRQDVPGTAIPCPSTASDQMNRYFDLLEQADRAELGVVSLTLTGPDGTLSFAVKH